MRRANHRPELVVTIRRMHRGRPGPAILATCDPAVLSAVERALGRRLTVAEPEDDSSPPAAPPRAADRGGQP